ncbi:MAG: rhamnogalacturonan acetylesterase, partial [Acidobacteriaceae bacterium]
MKALPLLLLLAAALPASAATPANGTFTCSAHGGRRVVALSAASRYSAATGFGFDLSASPSVFAHSSCASDQPFFFSTAAHDGNYRVILVLGGPEASTTTVRAESRRLLVDRLSIPANATRTVVFNVHVRTPQIIGSTPVKDNSVLLKVRLKPR